MRSTGSPRHTAPSSPSSGWGGRPRTLVLALCLALAPLSGPVSAAGLGRLTVQSALGQPLRAEVEVTSLSREDAQSLAAKLASPDAFRQAGLEYNPALNGLRFAIEPRGERTFLKITSNQPINEPFVDMLVELSWASGKLLREYTFLLDPPEGRAAVTPQADAAARTAEPAAPVTGPGAAPRAGARPPAQTATRPAPAPRAAAPEAPNAPAPKVEPAAAGTAAGGPVNVRRGDTLGRIAGTVRPEGVSLEQAMVAIYRANPSAFVGNLNLLREGSRLDIPDAAGMSAIAPAEAGREVRVQATDFNNYRSRLAQAAPKVDAPRAGQTASGAVSGRVQDSARADTGDRLALSKPAAGAGGTAAGAVGAKSGTSGVEQSVARDAAVKESEARIAELEKNVQDLRKLLDLRNRSMADMQRQLDASRAGQAAVSGAVAGATAQAGTANDPSASAPAGAAAPASAAVSASAPAMESPATPAGPATTSDTAVAKSDQAPSPASTSADAGQTAGGTAAAADQPAQPADSTAPPPPAAAASKPPAAPAEPVAEPGLLDDLLENPLLLPGLGGIAALGAGYALYAMRRRRKVESFEDSLVTSDTFTSNSLFGSTGGQSVDTNQGAFASPGAADVPSTEVDPIAEADVYIAYGREAQAEDILREALARQPERQPIRFKLLQICAARNDLDAFEVLARQMHDMTGGQGEDWEKAAALGLSLDPLNPLYGDAASGPAGATGGMGQAVAAGADSGRDFDFPDLELDLAAPRAAAEPVAAPRESLIETAVAGLDEVQTPEQIEPFELPATVAAPFGEPLAGLEKPAASVPSAPPAGMSADGLPSLDIDLDLDLPAKSVPPSSAETAAGRQPSAGAAEPSMDFDLDLAALENITQARPELAAADARGLPSFDLDLEPVAVQADADPASAGGSARWQEMSTKLDLASAYEEIGDKEGARELLQEVISGGDGTQQQKARAMLSKIG